MVLNKKVDNAKNILTSNGINYQVIGVGDKIVKQYPSKNVTITNKDSVYLITNNNITMPNLNGLSSKVATGILELLGFKVKLEGVGYVVEQSIPPDTPISSNLEITLKLSPKFS